MTRYEIFLDLRSYGFCFLLFLGSFLNIRFGISKRGQVVFDETDLDQHGIIDGQTRNGKSKAMTLMNLQMAEQGVGFAKIDMDSEGANETFEAIIESKWVSPEMKKKLIFLRPGPNQTFRYDPFETDLTGTEYRLWLQKRVKDVGRVLGRKQGVSDYKEQPRRERWMGNVLHGVGTKVNGKHMGLHRALELFNAGTEAWDRIMGKLKPHLPVEVAQDWNTYRWMSPRDRFIYTESTQNWFIQFFSDLVKETLSGKGEPIDFRKIVREGWILIADLGETQFFSKEQGEVFAAMMISSLLDAAYFSE